MKELKILYTPQHIQRRPPVNLAPGDEVYFGGEGFRYQYPRSALVALGKCQVSAEGIILKHFLPLKRFIVCYDIDFKHYYLRYIIHLLRRYRRRVLPVGEKYLVIFDNYSGPKGFFHWICDGLTRLVELNEELSEYTVLIPAYFQQEALYRDTLRLFNIGKTEVIAERSYVQAAKVYAIDFITPSGHFNPLNFRKLQQLVWNKYHLPAGAATEKIYISRAKASRRFVENEAEVVALMVSFGFRIVYLEDYTFEEQVRLAASAKYLVSIHGAALTHVFFMQPGSHVLEFKRQDDAGNYVYFSLADVAGVNYYYQFCKVTERSHHANNFDLWVDPATLRNTMQLMLSNP